MGSFLTFNGSYSLLISATFLSWIIWLIVTSFARVLGTSCPLISLWETFFRVGIGFVAHCPFYLHECHLSLKLSNTNYILLFLKTISFSGSLFRPPLQTALSSSQIVSVSLPKFALVLLEYELHLFVVHLLHLVIFLQLLQLTAKHRQLFKVLRESIFRLIVLRWLFGILSAWWLLRAFYVVLRINVGIVESLWSRNVWEAGWIRLGVLKRDQVCIGFVVFKVLGEGLVACNSVHLASWCKVFGWCIYIMPQKWLLWIFVNGLLSVT